MEAKDKILLDSKKVNIDDQERMQTLGEGAFGKVYLGKVKAKEEYIAIKKMKKYDIIKTKQVDHILNEIEILSILKHPFTIFLYGWSQDSSSIQIFIELVSGGEVFTYLREIGRFENQIAKQYAAQVCLIFEYLHNQDIIYRDLKPENLLISVEGFIKLTDFGMAKQCTYKTYTLCGTPEYLAPEVILNTGHGKPVDWWTLGVLIYEMIVGIDPFSSEDPMEVYQNILGGKMKFPKNFNKDARYLVKRFCTANLSKRQGNLKNGIKDIKDHKWFKDINWTDLMYKKVSPQQLPMVSSASDTRNFEQQPESNERPILINPKEDPFNDW